jgi:hypothetical protein
MPSRRTVIRPEFRCFWIIGTSIITARCIDVQSIEDSSASGDPGPGDDGAKHQRPRDIDVPRVDRSAAWLRVVHTHGGAQPRTRAVRAAAVVR